MIDGIKIILRDKKEYTVPPLTMGQLRKGALDKIRESDQFLVDGKAFESYAPRLVVIGLALRENHPDLTDEALEELIDMKNINPIWMAVLGASDLAGGDSAASGPPSTPTTSGPQ